MIGPAICPPIPTRHRLIEWRKAAKLAGIRPMAWQETAVRVGTARLRGRNRYHEVTIVVARQNGKTTLLVPLIIMELLAGRSILHTAQNRDLPRETFEAVADVLEGSDLRILVAKIRKANGQEEIRLVNGARYRIVAPTRSGARGKFADLVIVDEIRELDDFAPIAAIKPTLTTSKDPQIWYLSNAGDRDSVVLNDLKKRATRPLPDRRLAYMEWAARADRPITDRAGWAEANPALGRTIRMEFLEDQFASLPPAVFETEHLCRWVASMLPRLVSDPAWAQCAGELSKPTKVSMGVAVDPGLQRASAVLAWLSDDGTVHLTLAADVTGDPLDLDTFGRDLWQRVRDMRIGSIGHDPATDADLARWLPTSRPMVARELAGAADRFAMTVESRRMVHAGAEMVAADLAWTTRRPTGEKGAYLAVRSSEDHAITAALAAARAVWLATAPVRKASVHS